MQEHNTSHHEEAQPATAAASSGANWLLPVSILVAALLISGAVVYTANNRPAGVDQDQQLGEPAPKQGEAPAASDRDVILGNADAPISVIEFADFQCPFCSKLHEEVSPTLRAYAAEGKIKIAYRSFPFLGPESDAAAEAAECAKDQQKFWEYHDAIYKAEAADGQENNGNLNRALFMKIAGDLKLDTAAFGSCIDGGTYRDAIEAVRADAQQYGVRSTPTVFVNDQMVEGAYPVEYFTKLIDEML